MKPKRFHLSCVVLLAAGIVSWADESREPLKRLRGGEHIKSAVLRVEAGDRTGLGFLVDRSGLVVTDSDVATASQNVSVQVHSADRYRAEAVGHDRTSGIAIIRVPPALVEGVMPLPFWDPSSRRRQRYLRKGDPAWIVLDPEADDGIAEITVGGKVFGGTLVCYAGSIPESAMGGPLLSTGGEVIGVHTSAQARRGTAGGGGTCAYGIGQISSLLGRAREHVKRTDPLPPVPLTTPSSSVYPEELAIEAAGAIQDREMYRLRTGKVRVEFLTPPLIQREVSSDNGVYEPYRDFYNVGEYGDLHAPAVIVQGVPDLRVTAGSTFKQIGFGIGQAVAVGVWVVALPFMLFTEGDVAPPPIFPAPKDSYRFKRDLHALTLLRDGVEVPPLESELRCRPRKIKVVRNEKEKPTKRKLRGCHALNVYAPETFRPGADLSVRIFEDKKRTKSTEHPLDPDLVARIWADFRPWREALEPSGSATPIEGGAAGLCANPPGRRASPPDFTSEYASFESTD